MCRICGEFEVMTFAGGTMDFCSAKCADEAHEYLADDEPCRYCGGECPNQPDGNVCDYYAGDIDGLYSSEDRFDIGDE
jgi:hypothetical protein